MTRRDGQLLLKLSVDNMTSFQRRLAKEACDVQFEVLA